MTDPFRDPTLAERARAEHDADAAKLRAEEKANDDGRAAEVRARYEARQRDAAGPSTGWLGLGVVGLAIVGFVFVFRYGKPPREESDRPPVQVEPGVVRASSPTAAEDVRVIVARHASELAMCFDDGMARGELVVAPGPSKAFSFDWTIEDGGRLSKATTSHAGDPTAAEACMLVNIRNWWFEGFKERTEVTGWQFERCAVLRNECLHPKATPG